MYGEESTATTPCHTRDPGRMSRTLRRNVPSHRSRHAAQIESEWKVRLDPGLSHGVGARNVPHVVEAGDAAAFGRGCIDRANLVGAAAGVHHVVRAARNCPL